MADKDNAVEASPDAVEVEATLVHGVVYYLGNKVFEQGKPVPVTNAEREALDNEDHAGDVLTNDSGGERDSHIRMKFRFDPIGSNKGAQEHKRRIEAADGEPSPPRRVRNAGK